MQDFGKTKTLYLVKANDSFISHCKCITAPIGAPAQMDCPWCGCGWLFVCPQCRKAFTFARAGELDLSWEDLAHRDLDGKWSRQPTAEDIRVWIDFMKVMLKDLEPGREYVYLDGAIFPTDSKDIQFEGMHSWHELFSVPQVDALKEKDALELTLGSRRYWDDRKLAEH